MGHTVRGSKAPGYEYWSGRPNDGASPGAGAKKSTHRKERMQQKQQLRQELSQDHVETEWDQA